METKEQVKERIAELRSHPLVAGVEIVFWDEILKMQKSCEPDCDICSQCKEHAEFSEGESNCCGAPAYNSDPDIDMER